MKGKGADPETFLVLWTKNIDELGVLFQILAGVVTTVLRNKSFDTF